jgi:hypothetical protein
VLCWFWYGFGGGGEACLQYRCLQKICTFAGGFPTGSVLCKLSLTGYVLFTVHTILYSFKLAASVFAQGFSFEGPAPFSGGLCTCKGSKVSVCMGFPSLLSRLCKLHYSAGFGTSLGACLQYCCLQTICTFAGGFPTGSVLCKLPLTCYVLLMVHTILFSFTLAASVFAQGCGFVGPKMDHF